MIGRQIGPYGVLSKLGEGGMGEVYRARDSKLDRDVALKILPPAFAEDAERVARFRREAKTLAALNHPHIAQIYGLEEAAPSSGSGPVVTALVMELVTGENLAARIRRGPVPVDEALAIARQIAEALDAAHTAGIVHRDLKPANITIRDDGTVKVLDFGLAKVVEGAPGTGDVTNSPTITTPAMTEGGAILGTAAYMSPEQARGKLVDKRTDIWAFGCVLYEILTGQRAFAGETVTDVLSAIVRAEPDWSPDGRLITFNRNPRIWAVEVEGDRTPYSVITSTDQVDESHFSPDGRWIAYNSNESGTWQVYVSPFPPRDGTRWQISTDGGSEGRWRADGRELYYLSLSGQMMSVEVTPGAEFRAGVPRSLFSTNVNVNPLQDLYAVSADGQRFLVQRPVVDAARYPLTVVVNWQADRQPAGSVTP